MEREESVETVTCGARKCDVRSVTCGVESVGC